MVCGGIAVWGRKGLSVRVEFLRDRGRPSRLGLRS